MTTQEEINKKLEEMYGASFDCGIDKTGDNQVLKFYIETINDEFAFNKDEKLLQQAKKNTKRGGESFNIWSALQLLQSRRSSVCR